MKCVSLRLMYDFIVISDAEYQFESTILLTMVKFWSAITFFIVNLQAMETYPTCLRQTGISIGMIFSNLFGILGPYIAYIVRAIALLMNALDAKTFKCKSLEYCFLLPIMFSFFLSYMNNITGNQIWCSLSDSHSIGIVSVWCGWRFIFAWNVASKIARFVRGSSFIRPRSGLLPLFDSIQIRSQQRIASSDAIYL